MLGGNYLLQSSQPLEFTHQSMIFSSGGVFNPRKRERETLYSTSFCFSEQEQEQKEQQVDYHLLPSFVFSSLSEDFSAQTKRQTEEIDRFVQSQSYELQRTLAEWRERHYQALLGAAEETASRKLKEKEAEIEKAARRRAELEKRVANLKEEAQVWQAMAREQEAAAASLQSQLQHAIMHVPAHGKREEGEMSPADDAESAFVDHYRAISDLPPCQACRKRSVSVVLLPCRHLCLCNECDSEVDTCPRCNSLKSASVEVYLS